MSISSTLYKKVAHRLRPDSWTRHGFRFDVQTRVVTQHDGAGNVELRGTVVGAVDVPERDDRKRPYRINLLLLERDGNLGTLLALSAPDDATKVLWLDAVRSNEGGGGAGADGEADDVDAEAEAEEKREEEEVAAEAPTGPAPASALDGRLVSEFDIRALLGEKLALFKHGTREWAFKAALQWLLREDAAAPKVFWLMGGAGTGKTVVSAELLRRLREAPEEPVAGEEPARSLAGRLGAAHFFRHDDATTSDPVALLRSLAAQLCASVPGFEAALAAEDVDAALQAVKVEDAFAALLAKPLAALPPRPADAPRQVIILDALDELSAQQLGPVLDLITTCLVTLPEWLRLFVTSRDEAAIKAKLCAAGLEPEEVSSTMRAACCVLLATVAAMVAAAAS